MDEQPVTHDEALELIDAHIGERCYLGLHVARSDRSHEEATAMVFGLFAELQNELAPKPARTSPGVGAYACGSFSFHLPEFEDTPIVLRDHGVNFRIGPKASLRVAWQGSSELSRQASWPTL